MSQLFIESNNESAFELFNKKMIYRGKIKAFSSKYKNLTDFNLAEKFFYGRVNRRFIPVAFGARVRLRNLNSAFSKTSGLSAAIFVTDAFEDLVRQFDKCSVSGKINPSDPFLSNLRAFKAYTDPNKAYRQYMEKQFSGIANAFKKRNIKVRDFNEFLKELNILLNKSAGVYPFTQTAFMKSRHCPMRTNALTIEIADLDYANDDKKIVQFVKSKNWEFYLNACRSYGFMVDLAAPWRIVADIASAPMLSYAARYGVGSTNAILANAYMPAHQKYYKEFKFWLLRLYNTVKLKNFLITEGCGATSRRITPKSYSRQSLVSQFPESYFLKLYCQIRFLEEESQFKDFEKDILIDDTVELYSSRNIVMALQNFERILNKPFDYRGSMTYTIKQHIARRDAEEP